MAPFESSLAGATADSFPPTRGKRHTLKGQPQPTSQKLHMRGGDRYL